MGKVIRGIRTKVEVQKTLAAAVTITAISISAAGGEAQVTAASHGLTTGDVVRLAMTSGMPELNQWAGRVQVVDADTLNLTGVDSENYSAFNTGTLVKVDSWDSFDSLLGVDLPNQAAEKLDATTMHDDQKQEVLGLPGAVSGTMSGQFNPLEAAVVNVRNATRKGESRVFRITFEDGIVAVFNSDVAAGQGFSGNVNAIMTASYDISVLKFVNFYAAA